MGKRLKLSDQIRQAVQQCGLTRYRISKETGIDQAALSRFVSGERGLSFEALDALASYIGIDIVVRKPKGD